MVLVEMKGAGPVAAAEVRGGLSLEAISRELMRRRARRRHFHVAAPETPEELIIRTYLKLRPSIALLPRLSP